MWSRPLTATTFEGATEPPGGPHAEVVALRAAGAATPVVRRSPRTLEPCSHHGRTPPCVDAIVAAGIARVVVGIEDPDPHVDGVGVAQLRAAGIEVAHRRLRGARCARSSRPT